MAKTIEQLEDDFWPNPEFMSHVVVNSHALRQKPIDEFGVEDLRFMIGQNIGSQYLMPRALGMLEQTPLVGDFHYPGEVLHAVLRLPAAYWQAHPEHAKRVCGISQVALSKLVEMCERKKARVLHWEGVVLPDHKCLDQTERAIRDLANLFLATYSCNDETQQ